MSIFGKKAKTEEKMNFQNFRSKYNTIPHGSTITIEESSGSYTTITFARELEETTYRYSCSQKGDITEANGMISVAVFKL